jgi:hypothetical protein
MMKTTPINTPLQRLTLALDEAYNVFSIYPKPKRLEGSPLKDVDGIFRKITSEPLRKLGADKLSHFALSSIWTVGDVDDFRHFLPRILELEATEGALIDIESIAKKLKEIWSDWPAPERMVIERVLLAAFEYRLQRSPHELGAWEWLEGIDRLGASADQALSILFNANSTDAVMHWAAFIDRNATHLMTKGDFKEPLFSPKTHQAIRQWILSKTFAEQLFEAALEGSFRDEDDRLVLESAYDIVAGLQEP